MKKTLGIALHFALVTLVQASAIKPLVPPFFSAISRPLTSTSYYSHQEQLVHYEKFMQRYAPPKEFFKAEALTTTPEIFKPHIIKIKNEEISFFKKTDNSLNRIINAIRLKNCIQKYKLNLLDVSKKSVRFDEKNNKYVIYAENITPAVNTNIQPISSDLMKQLFFITNHTRFTDWHWGNWTLSKRDNDLKLICIDTEDESFYSEKFFTQDPRLVRYIKHLSRGCEENFGTVRLENMLKEKNIADISEIESVSQDFLRQPKSISLPENPEFDDLDINFELVKEYAQQIQSHKN